MNNQKIIHTVGEIDFDMVEDSEKDFNSNALTEKVPFAITFLNTKMRKGENNMKKTLTLAASICLIVLVAVFAFTRDNNELGEDNNDQSPDRSYAVIFNGYNYEPIGSPDFTRYPAISEISEPTAVGYKFNISEEHLGEYIGVFPAVDDLGWEEGKAYHYSAYPEYDSIIIVERNGEYSFYVAYSGSISPEKANNSTDVLYHYGTLEKIRIDVFGEERIIDGEDMALLLATFEGKTRVSYNEIERVVVEAWRREKGDDGVDFVDGEVTYDSAHIRQMFVEFMTGDGVSHMYIDTDNGFEIYIYYNPTFSYFAVDHYYYFLTDDDISVINEIIAK